MKQLFFITVIITELCSSCGSHNAEAVSNSTSAQSQQAASTNTAGDATFSYSLDGTKVSGGEVDELQINNVAEIYQSDPSGKELIFLLNDGEQKNTDIVAHSLRFTIPYKSE